MRREGKFMEYRMNEYFEQYFNGDISVCREERQYALFLYNRLLTIIEKQKKEKALDKNDKEILKACGIEENGIQILSAAYEATYMRDIFFKDVQVRNGGKTVKKNLCVKNTEDKDYDCFNTRLYLYVCEMLGFEKKLPEAGIYVNRNFGKKIVSPDKNLDEKLITELRQMMQSKPDLAIVYAKTDKNDKLEKHLKLIECKYLSPEGHYSGNSQTSIQDKIAEFLCGRILKDTKADLSNGTGDNIVYFRSKANKAKLSRKVKEEQCIDIEQLIPVILENE